MSNTDEKKLIPRAIHPFPARMAASIPWNKLRQTTRRPLRVLDPMAGSGTTLVVARTLGHKAIGFDSDPLAVLLGRVWCSDIRESTASRIARLVHKAAERQNRTLPVRFAYPAEADDETCAFVRYWFDDTNRCQLASLARAISGVEIKQVRELLWCAFSRLIITKQAGASRALDVSHGRPHRVSKKNTIRPLDHFLRSVDMVLSSIPFKSSDAVAPTATIRLGDARRLPIESSSIDIAISSPPYLNAIDYVRAHKFSLVWMGHSIEDLRKVRAENIGTEIGMESGNPIVANAVGRMTQLEELPSRERGWLVRYVTDMEKTISELSRVLVPKGRAVLVVGDTTMRDVYVRNSRAISYVGEHHNLQVVRCRRRKLPPNRRYLPPPSLRGSGAMLRNRLRTEVALELVKA